VITTVEINYDVYQKNPKPVAPKTLPSYDLTSDGMIYTLGGYTSGAQLSEIQKLTIAVH
jgi:hypothetical protein